MLLASTNDLTSRNANPELLIKILDDQITELKRFNNLGHIFLCKIPHRFDSHVVNSKVVRFNELLHERFSDTEEFLTVVHTIPPEFTFYYEDPSGVLNEPLQYDEVECVCSQLKPGATGVSIDYEHIRFAE